nr:unnamed protein product [Spirometra erinaceieuropaei]
MDVRNHSEVEASLSRVLGEFGKIDVLNKFFDCWKEMIATNCQGLIDVVSIVLADMLEKDSAGHIIVVSSDAGRAPFPGLSVYTGTKFFTEGFLRSLRLECKESKIRITSIQPGGVATPGQQWTTDTMASELYSPLCRPPAESEKALAAMLKPADIANAVIYALSQPEGVSINEILVQPTGQPC